MIDTYIYCYIKNKKVYTVHIMMTKQRFFEQLKENRLSYMSEKTGTTEIIYLDKFDMLKFSKNIEI